MVTLGGFVIVAIAIAPAIAWLFFFLREDLHPEPRRLLFLAFCFGALMSIPVLGMQMLFQNLVEYTVQNLIVLVFGLALIEELFKFLAAYLAVRRESAFDEPVDAMVYPVVAALGFATIENVFIAGGIFRGWNWEASIALSAQTMLLRLVGATLLHALTAAIIGYFWAIGIRAGRVIGAERGGSERRRFIALGIWIATIVHALFNLLVFRFQAHSLVFPSIFLVLVAFFVLEDFEELKGEA